MKISMGLLLFSCVLSQVAEIAKSETEDNAKKEGGVAEKLVVERHSTIETRRGGHLKADVDLGELPAGESAKIHLVVKNPFDRLIEFDYMRPGCACLNSKISSGSIPPFGSIEVDFEIQTPTRVNSVNQLVGAKFGKNNDKTTSLLVSLSYDLKGVVSFEQSMVKVKGIPEEEMIEWRLPILVTEPCKVEDVRVLAQGAFQGKLETEIQSSNGRHFVFCRMPTKSFTSTGVSGPIKLYHDEMGKEASVLCVALLEPDVEVAPDRVHMKYDVKRDCYQSSLLAKFREGVFAAGLSAPPSVSVDCRVVGIEESGDELLIKAKAKHLAGNVYRISLEARNGLEDKILSKSQFRVQYTVKMRGESWNHDGVIVLSGVK
ncbi:MAG: hypothetical protein AB8B50_15805 [Pirellulaceae bacterium]